MATINEMITVRKEVRGQITRYRFRYVIDTGETHYRVAWVSSAADEATVRTAKGVDLLSELAEAEFIAMMGV
jgi:hypothetical protein